jgi:hypothetical protein
MTLSDRIELQTKANGSKLVRVPADEAKRWATKIASLERSVKALRQQLAQVRAKAEADVLPAAQWRKLCRAQQQRRRAERFARQALAADEGKARV